MLSDSKFSHRQLYTHYARLAAAVRHSGPLQLAGRRRPFTMVMASPDLSSAIDLGVLILFVGFTPIALFANTFTLPLFHRSGVLMSYGKFAKKVTSGIPIPSRLGMSLLYVPSVILSIILLRDNASDRGCALAQLTLLHFAKRTLECFFLHNYSGTMPLLSSLMITIFYSIVTWASVHYSAVVPTSTLNDHLLLAGRIAFTVGQLGNFYHHLLLAGLRKGGSKAYAVPYGGLFEYVAAPHYLFELISWLGIVLAAQHLCLVIIFVTMTACACATA